MPDPRDDLAWRLANPDACIGGDFAVVATEQEWKVVAAALALAEELVRDVDDFACAVEFYITLETKEALAAYRAALAGRERGR